LRGRGWCFGHEYRPAYAPAPTRIRTPAGSALRFEKLQKELNLTPEQADQMQSILNDMWQYYRTVLSDSKTRVEQVLTQEQRVKFEHLLQQQR